MGGNSGAARNAADSRRQEAARQADIRAGKASIDSTFGQFDEPFYQALSRSYVDFARPQLDEEFGRAREQTTYQLARGGNLDSSSRVRQFGDLDRRYGIALQDVTDRGRQYATDARGNVESARSDLVANLQLTGDAQGATNAALSQARMLASTPAYSPLEQVFTDVTSGLASQIALERAAALGSPVKPRVNTGLFAPRTGSVKVS